MRQIVQHKQRIQKVLEDANMRLASVVADVFGESGRPPPTFGLQFSSA